MVPVVSIFHTAGSVNQIPSGPSLPYALRKKTIICRLLIPKMNGNYVQIKTKFCPSVQHYNERQIIGCQLIRSYCIIRPRASFVHVPVDAEQKKNAKKPIACTKPYNNIPIDSNVSLVS